MRLNLRWLPTVLAICCFYCTPQAALFAQTPLTVAVLPFETTLDDKELKGLDRALSEMLTTDLSKVHSIQVVERGRLHEVVKELELSSEGFIDPKTAAAIGKGVGAKAILTGSFHTQATRLRIDARLIHVETGKIIIAEEITGEMNDPFELEKRLQHKIIESLGIKLSKFEEAELSTKPTNNINAAAAFGRAAALQDTGDFMGAKAELSEALKSDPDFEIAQKVSEQIEDILNELENERFNALIERIADFEMSLHDWPRRRRGFFETGPYGINFDLDEYQAAQKAGRPDQMLFWWISSLGLGSVHSDFLDTLFGELDTFLGIPEKLGIAEDYMSVKAHRINLFWCDVYSSVPEYVPSEPLTKDRALSFVDSYAEGFQRRCLFRHEAVLFLKSQTLLALMKMQEATETAKKMSWIFKDRYSQGKQTAGEQILRVISLISNDPRKLSAHREQMKIDAFIWANAEKRIIDRLAEEQRLLLVDYWNPLPEEERIKEFLSFGEKQPMSDEDKKRRFELADGNAIIEYFAETMFLKENEGGGIEVSLNYMKRKADEYRDAMFKVSDNHPFLLVEDDREIKYHLAGCPFAGLRTGRSCGPGNPPLKFTGFTDLRDVMEKDYHPCMECLPFRWIDRQSLVELLQKNIPATLHTLRSIIAGNDRVVRKKNANHLRDLLLFARAAQAKELSEQICDIVKAYALSASDEDELQQSAVLTLACSSKPEHVRLLGDVLGSSVTPDVKMFAVLSLLHVGNKQADEILANAEATEPYYFIRHWITAARSELEKTGKAN